MDRATCLTASITDDATDYELGTRFQADRNGIITELRYYRGAPDAGDTDTRTLHLWDANGILLGSTTVAAAPGATGWQVGALAAPIAISAGATYTVSYGTVQNYAATSNFFTTQWDGPDGILNGAAVSGNGVFSAGSTGLFPTSTHNNSNYWVDVTFQSGSIDNDAPAFTGPAALSIIENSTVVGALTATDANNNPLTFGIAGGSDAARFSINAGTGVLSFVAAPDFEVPGDAGGNNVYDVVVSVSDGMSAVQRAYAITVVDNVNESAVTLPVDANGAVNTVNESAAVDTLVGITASSTDADATDTVTYSLTNDAGGRFAINGTTGVVTVANGTLLDRETAASHNIVVRATSTDGSTADTTFTINLNDVNESAVTLPVDNNAAANAVNENAAAGTLVGITASATDPDATNDIVSYASPTMPAAASPSMPRPAWLRWPTARCSIVRAPRATTSWCVRPRPTARPGTPPSPSI